MYCIICIYLYYIMYTIYVLYFICTIFYFHNICTILYVQYMYLYFKGIFSDTLGGANNDSYITIVICIDLVMTLYNMLIIF